MCVCVGEGEGGSLLAGIAGNLIKMQLKEQNFIPSTISSVQRTRLESLPGRFCPRAICLTHPNYSLFAVLLTNIIPWTAKQAPKETK